jgi:hypothetical protein
VRRTITGAAAICETTGVPLPGRAHVHRDGNDRSRRVSSVPELSGEGTIFSVSTGLEPFVKSVPTAGKVGTTVIILGTDLTAASAVSFNGKAAEFKVVSPTEITATVPSGATTGTVQVTTPSGTLKSWPFQVL